MPPEGVSTIPCCHAHGLAWLDLAQLDILHEPPVKVGPPVAEEAERRAVLLRLTEVERRHQCARLLRSELREDVAALVADEAVAVEALAVLGADAVGGDHRH